MVDNVDRAPILAPLDEKTIKEGTLLTFSLSASDPDGNAVFYSIVNTPTGATLISNTGVFSWTPDNTICSTTAPISNCIITFTATSAPLGTANTLSDFTAITITVINVDRPPTLASPGNKTAYPGDVLTFTLSATDPDKDSITYTMSGGPSGAALNPATGAFQWSYPETPPPPPGVR